MTTQRKRTLFLLSFLLGSLGVSACTSAGPSGLCEANGECQPAGDNDGASGDQDDVCSGADCCADGEVFNGTTCDLACEGAGCCNDDEVFNGLSCVPGLDACEASPDYCQGHGQCAVVEMAAVCQSCDEGFFGARCQNACDCDNGTCDDGPLGAGACECADGFEGGDCGECNFDVSALSDSIDGLANALVADQNWPGLTVAISLRGRLLYAQGYGLANVDTAQPMTHNLRSRIGSVTKAIVTGGAGFQLMRDLGLQPETTSVYGPDGVFGETYSDAWTTAAARHTPIVALAIGPNDVVYAWYANGTVSLGSANDLSSVSAPVPFVLPSGKSVLDLRAAAITSAGQVYTWYDDRSRAIGTATDLAATSGDAAPKASLPPGKSILHVMGAGIAKSDSHVYVWYEDGTRSSGTSLDFDFYSEPGEFSATPGVAAHEIRGFGLDSNNETTAWYTNDTYSSGWTFNLDAHAAPAPYVMPDVSSGMPQWNDWWPEITIQHLLDHRAGLTRSGDVEGAAAFNGVSEDSVTYAQIHDHFVSTRKLLGPPDGQYSYSNHGFGMWTIIIEALAGKSFADYVEADYLTPMGLSGVLVPQQANASSALVAQPHVFSNGTPATVPHGTSTVGMAAGGFTASAMGLVDAMIAQQAHFSPEEQDALGWGRNNQGKLAHNGFTIDGAAYGAMFPEGYIESSGEDLSGINVAAITNIGGSTGALTNLTNQMAALAAAANVPACFDQWQTLGAGNDPGN